MLELLIAANIAAYPLSDVKHDPKVPAEYLYMYQGKLRELPKKTPAEVMEACTRFGAPSHLGCAFWTPDRRRCTVVWLERWKGDKPHVYWHEIAHCNGYDHD